MTVDLDTLYPVMEEYLRQGKEVTFTITGRSMAPTLRHGRDQVTVTKPSGPLKKGDLPLYRRDNGKFILHRVVGVSGGEYMMCGDGQAACERGITDGNILAVAVGIVRNGKKIPVSSPGYRLWVSLWIGLLPVRRYLLRIIRLMRPELFVIDRDGK
ncbi:MAG: S24/S26 family peptidase [Abditibacteriota bacterium]|nr:S24/S26 family peptidase [Abditibacteriota bacterium]